MGNNFDFLLAPRILPPLDTDFRPAILANTLFLQEVKSSGKSEKLVLGLERMDGSFSRFETLVFSETHTKAEQNLFFVERLLKFLLWQRGGWKIYVGGPRSIGNYIKGIYLDGGKRQFDSNFMGNIYTNTFTVIPCDVVDVPPEKELENALGRYLEGNRIGFDLGASDLKVSAVVDGKAIFSTEIEWQPSQAADPKYHRQQIREALNLAASKFDHLDAIGGSSAGVYVNNRPMIASLFRGIPRKQFHKIHSMFLDFKDEFGVPLEIVNDGEVTALAGSMALEDNGVLGIAMGSSEAAGYVTMNGNITDWLNELAFAPVDYNPNASVDEWSGDRGVGALYFSQQCVFRLALKADIEVPQDVSDAQKLEAVQEKLESGHEGARQIWETMAVYLGYTLAHYSDFYDLKHVLILGRCTSGKGGTLILAGAKEVLQTEFPTLAKKINVQLPDEKSRRVGQSIAAASLPQIKRC
ncbi:MAG: ROK family protein [Anaerolineales bacterium]|jgi:predicted NBD/HSP70 family sugar kinase